MRPPESSTEGKADLKSHYDSSQSRLDGSNKFGEDDVDWTVEGEGSVSVSDDLFCSITDSEILEMNFVSEDEAGRFYNSYAKANGFSIRKSRSKLLKDNPNLVRFRTWVCSREGKRHSKHFERVERRRRPRAETRMGCGAKFCVRYVAGTQKYMVKEFVRLHNHPVVAQCCAPFLRSHRRLNDVDTAQAMALRKVGVKADQIMDYMTCQSGGSYNVGFTKKDLRNKLAQIHKEEIKNGDAEGALGYLHAQVCTDPLFFVKYTVDKNDRLETLFWADGRSRMEYASFGDVLVFDTTYRTNAYKKPFVILAGVSNNFKTTIFGCALLCMETEETYNWVLATFLEAMDGKHPISVVTDGDLAMRNAIINIFPNARHRLCSWHLERNAMKNVHKPDFVTDFTNLMQMECEVEEFESLWADMVTHYGLQTNNWVLETYRDRERWAEAYLLGHFFAGMRTTQRCEGMNRHLNRFLTVRLRLYEFVEQYHRAVVRLRLANVEAKTATEHSTPVLITQLKSLEKNATEVYTQYMFKLFQDEIQRTYPLLVEQRVDELQRRLYFIEVYSHPERKWTVEYFPIDSKMKCSCLMFESFGLPCCHMIMVMKQEQLLAIPTSLVMRRWTRSACPEAHHPTVGQIPQSLSSTHAARYGVLSSGYNLMSFYASHSRDSFEDAKDLGHEMTSWMRKRWEMGKNKECTTSLGETSYVQDLFGVGDPLVAKTKGNPGKNSTAPNSRKPRQCRHCKCAGHDKRTCPKLSSKPSIE